MSTLIELSSSLCFRGQQKVFAHSSQACQCSMKFSMYLPPKALGDEGAQLPVLYFLAGINCTTDNFVVESGFQRYASENNLIVVSPDTSPRDTGIEGEASNSIYTGHGAGMYVDCTTEKWRGHYNMFTYVTKELIQVVEENFKSVLPGHRGIFGHSMGGHGALLCGLKRPELYLSVSALAPAATLSNSGLTHMDMAFKEYLGPDRETWKEWDACELAKSYDGRPLNIKVDIGACDDLRDLLKPWALVQALGGSSKLSLDLTVHSGYDHDYYFVSSFVGDHIAYHADVLNKRQSPPLAVNVKDVLGVKG